MASKIPKTQREGLIFNTNYGPLKIIEYKGWDDVKVKFMDTGTIIEKVFYSRIIKGAVKDPMLPTVFGVGCMGQNHVVSKTTEEFKQIYKIWHGMLLRVYYADQPAYYNVKVAKRWKNFSNFLTDILKMDNWNRNGFQLDKDLRVTGNKIYDAKYCSFVPKVINSLFIGLEVEGSLPRGVWKHGNKYAAQMQCGGYKQNLGTYPTIKEAHQVYCVAKAKRVRKLIDKYKNVLHEDILDNFLNVRPSFFNEM